MKKFLLFLLLNFGALAMGMQLITSPAQNTWYQALNLAPWTPPGWFFGVAWSSLMLCFSIYMAKGNWNKKIGLLFGLQWILNVAWNPIFFRFHFVLAGLIILVLLLSTLFALHRTLQKEKSQSILGILPYMIWLVVAMSLNGYVLLYN